MSFPQTIAIQSDDNVLELLEVLHKSKESSALYQYSIPNTKKNTTIILTLSQIERLRKSGNFLVKST
jgi:hypothetical protein